MMVVDTCSSHIFLNLAFNVYGAEDQPRLLTPSVQRVQQKSFLRGSMGVPRAFQGPVRVLNFPVRVL